jgi:hypothetical protein
MQALFGHFRRQEWPCKKPLAHAVRTHWRATTPARTMSGSSFNRTILTLKIAFKALVKHLFYYIVTVHQVSSEVRPPG